MFTNMPGVSPSGPLSRDSWWTPLLAWPLAVAAAIRLTLMMVAHARNGSNPFSVIDTSGYLLSGRYLLFHGSFVAQDGQPYLSRTPGYPLFLALISLPGPEFAVLVQVILSALTVVLVWRLARGIFEDDRIALLSAWIFAIEPISIFNSILLMSETLFLVLFLLSLERLVQFLRGHRLLVLAEAGIFLAAATFVRPVTYYLPIPLALSLSLVLPGVPALRWKAPAVLLLTVLPWLAAWQIRNWVETGFSSFTSVGVENLYFWETADLIARTEKRPIFQVMRELGGGGSNYVAAHPEQVGWSQAQRLDFMKSETDKVVRQHFGLFLLSRIQGSTRVAFSPAASDLISQMTLADPTEVERMRAELHAQGPLYAAIKFAVARPFVGALMAGLEILLLGTYFFAVKGVLRRGVPGACLWLLFGVWLYFMAISGGALGGGRYRLPVMPIICIFAAAGIRIGGSPHTALHDDISRIGNG
jgi:hypothetical protein